MMQEAVWPTVQDLGNHWHWRPEWHKDRPCLLWYLTFEDQPQLTERALQLEDVLRHGENVDVVPPEWLHLTLDDVAYADEVSPDQVEALAETMGDAVSDCLMPPLELGPLVAMPSAVVLRAGPRTALSRLRDRVRVVSKAVLGRDKEPLIRDFWPHVTLAYVNDACAERSVMAPLDELAFDTVRTSVSRLTLASVTRRDQHYQWTARAVLSLPGRPGRCPTHDAEESHAP